MAKSVKVHDDTHAALKELKMKNRRGSIDEVVRELIRSTTGEQVGRKPGDKEARITSYTTG